MDKLNLISVIVTSYNHSKYLKERLDSLINQTYQNFEIIVLDDCSTENNLEILEEYKDNKKIRIVAGKKNRGLVKSTNLGIAMAKGEYVLIAQCDDSCSPELLEMLVNPLISNPSCGLSFARSNLINNQGLTIGCDFENRENKFKNECKGNIIISGHQMRQYLMHSCVIPNLSAVLFRRSVFERVGKFSSKYKACIDWDIFFKMCSYYNFYYLASPLNNFRQHELTIRETMSVINGCCEFISVLLGQISNQHFNLIERNKYRLRAMYIIIVNTPFAELFNLKNLKIIFKHIYKYDKLSLCYFPVALLVRSAVLLTKKINIRIKK